MSLGKMHTAAVGDMGRKGTPGRRIVLDDGAGRVLEAAGRGIRNGERNVSWVGEDTRKMIVADAGTGHRRADHVVADEEDGVGHGSGSGGRFGGESGPGRKRLVWRLIQFMVRMKRPRS